MKKRILVYCAILFFIIVLIGAYLFNYYNNISKTENIKDIKREITVTATGDIMYHMMTYVNNYNEETGKYDFSGFYEKMMPYIEASDIMVANYETTSSPDRLYSGFPCFNTPPESIEYLKKSGFDLLSTANNHCIDTGINGILSTIEIMDRNNIGHFGTYKENSDRGIIIEKNNIKVGFLGYSENFNGMDSLIPEDKQYMISKFNIENIKSDIESLKEKGADFIIIYPHWGVEYSSVPSDFQKFMNRELLKAGADAVLGSHPHVLQRAEEEIIDGQKKFTIYSMGNSISNQRREWMKREGTEAGVFVKIKISKLDSEKKAHIESVDLIPTYVNRYRKDGKFVYEVIALKDYIEGGNYRNTIDEATKQRIDKNYEDALKVLYSVGD